MTPSVPAPGPAASPAQRLPHPIHSRHALRVRFACLRIVGVALFGVGCLAAPRSSLADSLPSFHGAVVLHDVDVGYGEDGAALSLDRLARLGASSIGLVPYGYQLSPNSPFIEGSSGSSWSTNDERLRDSIAMAQVRGMRVILMPKLSLQEGWSADIRMGDDASWDKWFDEYERWILHYADLAEAEAVDLLVIGSELVGSSDLERRWRRLIAKIRRRYSGPISYGAHWGGELQQIRFWDALDAIGLAAYAPLSPKREPVYEELRDALGEQLQPLAEACRRWERPGLLTEIGFRSVADGRHLSRRRERPRGRPSEETQALAYRAVGEVLADPPWLRGILWSGFDSNPVTEPTGEQDRRSFSPLGKLAEAELRAIWQDPRRVASARRPRGHGGMVVTSDSLATRVGVSILRDGGNAVDAAVATALALSVTHPQAAALGGGGFLVAKEPGRRPWGLDFREMAPLRSHEHQFLAWELRGDSTASRIGPRAAAIPGNLAGYYEAWQHGGRLPWSSLVEPARRLAAEGFPVGRSLARDLAAEAPKLRLSPMARNIFFSGGETLKLGSRLVQPELAALLLAVASEGDRALYRGAVANALAGEIEVGDGIWSPEDLRRYGVRRLRPVEIPVGPRSTVVALPAPSTASTILGQSLYFLRRLQAESMPAEGPERARALIEALRLSMADRAGHLADPALMKVQSAALLRSGYLRRRARMLPAFGPGDSDRVASGEVSRESDETTHLIVFDQAGRCVSLSTSLSGLFGSGWMSPSSGVLLNAAMGDFDREGDGPNRAHPGARMLSDMSPTLVLRDGETWLALGGRGGTRILSGVLQVIVHRLWDDWPLDRAIAAPRLHHGWLPDRVEVENTRPWPSMAEDLGAMGYQVDGVDRGAKIHGAERLPDGSFIGVCDPRDAGLASAVYLR